VFTHLNASLIKTEAIFSGFSKQPSFASYANFMYIFLHKLGQSDEPKKKRSISILSPPSRLLRKAAPEPKPHSRRALPGKRSPSCPPTPAEQTPGAYRTPNSQPPHRAPPSPLPPVCTPKRSLAVPRSQSCCQAHPGAPVRLQTRPSRSRTNGAGATNVGVGMDTPWTKDPTSAPKSSRRGWVLGVQHGTAQVL